MAETKHESEVPLSKTSCTISKADTPVVNEKAQEFLPGQPLATDMELLQNGSQPFNSLTKEEENKPDVLTNKKAIREGKGTRRKDERSVEQVLRTLNGFESPQDKLAALCKKYADIIDDNRKLQLQIKNIERRLLQAEKERDAAQGEHSKAVLTRSRLEGLCRELQRQNKAIKDESLLKIREEEEKRKEVSNKFQTTLSEISSLMQQNSEKNSKLRDDNIEMSSKFKTVCEQYELRVQQVEKISKQMQLEAQLADAKLAKCRMESAAEKETLLREKQELLMELAQYQSRCQELQQTEIDLRSQIELYTNKYDEFQNALSKSNEIFGGFKGEMNKMSKKIVKLEKETSTWKLRWEKSHQALLEMAADKQQRDADLALANRQLKQLHKLCRTLTEERSKLMAQINGAVSPEKNSSDLEESRLKLNETLDSLKVVLTEREQLHDQQQEERIKQQQQKEQEKPPEPNQEEFSDASPLVSANTGDKKKARKHKKSQQSESEAIAQEDAKDSATPKDDAMSQPTSPQLDQTEENAKLEASSIIVDKSPDIQSTPGALPDCSAPQPSTADAVSEPASDQSNDKNIPNWEQTVLTALLANVNPECPALDNVKPLQERSSPIADEVPVEKSEVPQVPSVNVPNNNGNEVLSQNPVAGNQKKSKEPGKRKKK